MQSAALSDLGSGSDKWVDGVLGNDGKIYGIPRKASKVLCITWNAGDALLHAWEKGETPDYLLAAFSSYAQGGKLAAASVHALLSKFLVGFLSILLEHAKPWFQHGH